MGVNCLEQERKPSNNEGVLSMTTKVCKLPLFYSMGHDPRSVERFNFLKTQVKGCSLMNCDTGSIPVMAPIQKINTRGCYTVVYEGDKYDTGLFPISEAWQAEVRSQTGPVAILRQASRCHGQRVLSRCPKLNSIKKLIIIAVMILRKYIKKFECFAVKAQRLLGSQNSSLGQVTTKRDEPFFYGFYDGFSNGNTNRDPSIVAHLAMVKEQSRGKDGRKYYAKREALRGQVWKMPSLFPNTSIQQFFKVLAMSTLTTGDLETVLNRNNRIVTSRRYHQVLNTAHEDVRGEERKCE